MPIFPSELRPGWISEPREEADDIGNDEVLTRQVADIDPDGLQKAHGVRGDRYRDLQNTLESYDTWPRPLLERVLWPPTPPPWTPSWKPQPPREPGVPVFPQHVQHNEAAQWPGNCDCQECHDAHLDYSADDGVVYDEEEPAWDEPWP